MEMGFWVGGTTLVLRETFVLSNLCTYLHMKHYAMFFSQKKYCTRMPVHQNPMDDYHCKHQCQQLNLTTVKLSYAGHMQMMWGRWELVRTFKQELPWAHWCKYCEGNESWGQTPAQRAALGDKLVQTQLGSSGWSETDQLSGLFEMACSTICIDTQTNKQMWKHKVILEPAEGMLCSWQASKIVSCPVSSHKS